MISNRKISKLKEREKERKYIGRFAKIHSKYQKYLYDIRSLSNFIFPTPCNS